MATRTHCGITASPCARFGDRRRLRVRRWVSRARRLFDLAEPPTAIFGCNDEIAAGALAAAQSTGLNVPYDVSIAGFEDSPFSHHSWPPLTTARQRADIIVERATRMLIARIRGEAIDNEGFNPELVFRGSTAPPRPRSRRKRR